MRFKQAIATAIAWAACCAAPAWATTITENFNTADSGTLGPTLSWTEQTYDGFAIVSNEAQFLGTSSPLIARANTDLASTDHYAQVTITNNGTGGAVRYCGVIARKDSSTTQTYYVAYIKNGSNVGLYKCVAGSLTQLGSDAAITFGSAKVLKLTCNGSTISVDYDGVNKISQTDTAITSGVRCGLACYQSSSGITVNPLGDSFEAGDLAAASTFKPRVIFIGQTFNPFRGTAWSANY